MIPWWLWIGLALARAGGGQEYSGGGGSGGGSYGGGGGSVDGEAIQLLIWLVFRYPAVGVPVVIVVVGYVIWSKQHAGERRVVRARPAVEPAPPSADATALQARDPMFSVPLFLDFARLVYTRAQEARGRGDTDVIRPFVSPDVIEILAARGGGTGVRDVILGASRIEAVGLGAGETTITVGFEGNLTERGTKLFVREAWTFSRAASAVSLGPDRMRVLACPSCGSPSECGTDGRCRSCGTVVDDGRLQWRVVRVRVRGLTPAPPLQLTPGAGWEVGTDLPLVAAPDLAAQLRALLARHPDLKWEDLHSRFTEIFLRIQRAWSGGRWEDARPFETDFLFQQHRYWMERYAKEGLRNHIARVHVADIKPARVTIDPYVEAVTVRIYARMRDWTEDRDGNVVGGSRSEDRIFSEYWTFLRSAGGAGRPRENLDQCPSCGAPLDRVSETGVCGYCEAKITGGEHDWVLSAIEQDEAYRG
jgi:predicted lipid-binding transport protein (Tim44 family)